MPKRILLTTTSFQDTPGAHHDVLKNTGYEIVTARGPLSERQMLDLIAGPGFDGLLNGDDQITARVIDAALPRLKVIAKYGIGLDSIDVPYASSKKIPVLFTPGVNHTTVAEHCFGLMIAMAKHFWPHLRSTKAGGWKRITGTELAGKTISVLGIGRVGKEVIKRARVFEMNCRGYTRTWDPEFAAKYEVKHDATLQDAVRNSDIISLHMNLDETNRGCINRDLIATMKRGAMLINTGRGGLVVEKDVVEACKSGQLGGYATDVMDPEPPPADHIFREIDNIIVTPHIGSRTLESVGRQAMRTVLNLSNFLNGKTDFIQANKF